MGQGRYNWGMTYYSGKELAGAFRTVNGCSGGVSKGKLFGDRKFVTPKEGWQ